MDIEEDFHVPEEVYDTFQETVVERCAKRRSME